MKRKSTFQLVVIAMFAALTAVLAQFSVPIGPVPICLSTLGVYLAGGILGAAGGTVSIIVYVLLGAAGLPVFAGFSGGFHVIAGPTGGYIFGFVACAWIIGILSRRFGRKLLPLVFSMILGTAVCYILGTAWFMFVTKRGLMESLALCVIPFLIGDAAKIALSAAVVPQLGKVFDKLNAKVSAA
ncbi:MAG TPA: biotin transporter BioY [Caproicibacter sp.]|nr:biotin transporter BioY [Caproicibacter sp.]